MLEHKDIIWVKSVIHDTWENIIYNIWENINWKIIK